MTQAALSVRGGKLYSRDYDVWWPQSVRFLVGRAGKSFRIIVSHFSAIL